MLTIIWLIDGVLTARRLTGLPSLPEILMLRRVQPNPSSTLHLHHLHHDYRLEGVASTY